MKQASVVFFPLRSSHVAMTLDLPFIPVADIKTVEVCKIDFGTPSGKEVLKFILLQAPGYGDFLYPRIFTPMRFANAGDDE
jgi:hypothetical protein